MPCPVPGELHPSPPPICTLQERRKTPRPVAKILPCHHYIRTPAPPQHPTTWGEPQGARPAFPPSAHVLLGGGHPRHGLPSPTSLQQLFPSLQGCAARPPHPQPWKRAPRSSDSTHCCCARQALPFHLSTTETRQTGKPRHGKGRVSRGGGGNQEHTCRKLGAVERGKSNKALAGITTSIPNTRMLECPAAASSTLERFPTDKGGRQSQHPPGSKASIPREAKPASLGKHAGSPLHAPRGQHMPSVPAPISLNPGVSQLQQPSSQRSTGPTTVFSPGSR